uniref:Uncharacterized protein n=1 Tax=Arundo donax TaxID=35708 RepID=A0A0A8YIR8_ARUDO
MTTNLAYVLLAFCVCHLPSC